MAGGFGMEMSFLFASIGSGGVWGGSGGPGIWGSEGVWEDCGVGENE
jgi:hypothetical protein